MFWLDIVNAAFDWSEIEDVHQFLKELLPATTFDPPSTKSFWQTMRFIRAQMSAAHFQGATDYDAINHKLSSIKLEFAKEGAVMPALRARASGGAVRQLEETVFLQFAAYLSQCRSSCDILALRRCEGFYRPDKPLALLPDEGRWRSEIPQLEQLSDSSSNWQRCGDFFVSTRGRFCSEACRTRTFQIAKQLHDPEYLAEKQRRYRARKSASQPPRKT